MSDVKIIATQDGGYSFSLEGGDLETEGGLEAAVLVSLFSNKRVPEQEAVDGNRGGWWADVFAENGDEIGSKLWTLARSKVTLEVITQFEAFALEALNWLLLDGVASKIEVSAEAKDSSIFLEVKISRPSGDSKFNFLWDSLGVSDV